MKTYGTLKKIVPLLALVLAAASCSTSDLDKRLDGLDGRVTAIEDYVSKINDNIIAANALYRKNVLITDYKATESGYELTLSSGETLKITFGDKIDGNAPIIGVEDGKWVISTDGGDEFTEIEGTEPPGNQDGKTPMVKVDKYGFWIISTDGGQNWTRILNEKGDPISAKDGKSMGGEYNFFSSVSYNKETGNLDIVMVGGDSLSIPVKKGSSIKPRYYYDGIYAFAGKEVSFPVEMTGVDNAVWTYVPEGWRARLEDGSLVVAAPEDGKAGSYTLEMLAFTDAGDTTPYKFTFTYDPKLIFREDFSGAEIDERYWSRYKHGEYTSEWDMYQEGDPAQSFQKDGLLTMLAVKYGDTYRTGAVDTRKKMTFEPPFRVDCSARFTQMADGVWYAIWICPVKGYQFGEIDIMEKSNFGTMTQHTAHNPYTLNCTSIAQDQKNSGKSSISVSGQFNTYSVECREDAVVFFVNGQEVYRYRNIPHSESDPAYLKLNENERPYYMQNFTFPEQSYAILLDIAVGGNFPGCAINDEELPGQFDVDWISVIKL